MWEEGGVRRGSLTRTVRRSGGGRCPFLRLHQRAKLEVSFVSTGWEYGALPAVYFAIITAIVFRWCALLELEVLCAKRSTVAESLGALEAMVIQLAAALNELTVVI